MTVRLACSSCGREMMIGYNENGRLSWWTRCEACGHDNFQLSPESHGSGCDHERFQDGVIGEDDGVRRVRARTQ